MRIVVTGATGTVGPHVLQQLLDRGRDAVRQPAGRDVPQDDGRVTSDATDPATFAPAVAGVMVGLYTSARLGFAARLADGAERSLSRPRSLRQFAQDVREVWA